MHDLKRLIQLKRTLFSLTLIMGLAVLCCESLMAEEIPDGYLSSVSEERNIRRVELILVQNPVEEGIPLKDLIFDDELTGEFGDKFEKEFGQTPIERNIEAPNRYNDRMNSEGEFITEEEHILLKQRFGEYMVRRLAEHHVDQYIRENPSTRQIYELKEKVSKIKLQVKRGYNLKVNYSFSGNSLSLALKNPHKIGNEVLLEMDPNAVGPSSVEETLVSFSYPTGAGVTLSSLYKMNDGIVDLVGSKPLSYSLTASITGTTYTKSEGISDRENRILFGLTWVD